MNKQDILKKEGLTEEQFYKLYPTQEAYLMKCGGTMAQLGQQIPKPIDYGYALLMQDGGVPSYNFPALMKPDVTDSMIYEQHFKSRYNNNPLAIKEHERFEKYGISPEVGKETYIAANMWRNAYDDAVKQQNIAKQQELIKNGIETGIINYNQKAFPGQPLKQYGGECPECEEAKNGKWIQGAVKHPGRCTPGSPNYDCPKGSPQWNLAQTFKKHHGFHKKQDGGNIIPDGLGPEKPKPVTSTNKTIPGQDSSDFFQTRKLQLTDFLHKSAQPVWTRDIKETAHNEFMSQFQPQIETGMPMAQGGAEIQAWQNWYAAQPPQQQLPAQPFNSLNQAIDLYTPQQPFNNNLIGSPTNESLLPEFFSRNQAPQFPNNKLNTPNPGPFPQTKLPPSGVPPNFRNAAPDFPKNDLNSSDQTLDKYMNPGLTTDYEQNQKNKTAQAGAKGIAGKGFDWMGIVNTINNGVGTMAQLGENKKQDAYRNAHRAKPEDWSAIYQSYLGNYTDGARFSGSNYKPNQTQYGMYGPIAQQGGQMNYNIGDEVEMDKDQLDEFLANGGQIEMLM